MTTITGLAEAVLYVSDLDRATQFYRQVLDLPLSASFDDARFLQTGPSSTLILFNVEGIEQRQSRIPSHGALGEGHVALAIRAGEMDSWRERLQAHGIAIEHEQDWPQGTHSIYFRDPDDNSIEFIDEKHCRKVWAKLRGQRD